MRKSLLLWWLLQWLLKNKETFKLPVNYSISNISYCLMIWSAFNHVLISSENEWMDNSNKVSFIDDCYVFECCTVCNRVCVMETLCSQARCIFACMTLALTLTQHVWFCWADKASVCLSPKSVNSLNSQMFLASSGQGFWNFLQFNGV